MQALEGGELEPLEEMREDLRKVRRTGTICFYGAIGTFVLGVALIILFLIKEQVPSLLLGIAGFVWAAVLLNQFLKSREMEDRISAMIDKVPAQGAEVGVVTGEPTDVGEGVSTSREKREAPGGDGGEP